MIAVGGGSAQAGDGGWGGADSAGDALNRERDASACMRRHQAFALAPVQTTRWMTWRAPFCRPLNPVSFAPSPALCSAESEELAVELQSYVRHAA